MVVGIEKLSYGEIAARLADRGRPLAKKVVSVVTKPKGHPKMEIPREAYRGKGLTLEEWWGGRQVAKAVERAREARKAEELLSASKSLSRGRNCSFTKSLTRHSLCPAIFSVMFRAWPGLKPLESKRHRATGGLLVLRTSFKVASICLTST